MTDYFALLQQARKPWLDPDQLKQRYQERTLSDHPDVAGAGASSVDFAAFNEAYRSLKDPKLRLQHLLRLEGHDPGDSPTVPGELLDLFSRIGNFVQTTDGVLSRARATQNALAKSLIHSEILSSRQEAAEILRQLQKLHDEAVHQTRALNESWTVALPEIAALSRRFAYLGRWMEQVEERKFQLDGNL